MPEGVEFPFPSLLFHEGRTYGQPEVVRISLLRHPRPSGREAVKGADI